jgi:hypothetical protein
MPPVTPPRPCTVLADQFAFATPVKVNGASITFDVSTVGVDAGSYSLRLMNVIDDPTNNTTFVDASSFANVITPTASTATLTVVPEPTSLALLSPLGGVAA